MPLRVGSFNVWVGILNSVCSVLIVLSNVVEYVLEEFSVSEQLCRTVSETLNVRFFSVNILMVLLFPERVVPATR